MPSRIALFTKLNQQCRCYYIKPRPALKCADAIATIRAVIGIKLTVEKFGIEHEAIMRPDPYPVDVDDVMRSSGRP